MIKRIIFFFLILLPILGMAQPEPKDNSPYSRFGLGDITDKNFFASASMGGLGASFTDPYQINIVNPASLGYLTATTFDVGVFGEYSGLRDSNIPEYDYNWNGNLAYLSLAIPLQNKLNDLLDRKERNTTTGMAFTLMPYSTVGYNIATLDQSDFQTGDVTRLFRGSGGTYQFLYSGGVRHKQFAGGFNVGYLFGKIENERAVTFNETEVAYATYGNEQKSLSGFLWNFGAMYTLDLNEKELEDKRSTVYKRVTFGLHGNSGTNLNTTTSLFEGAERQLSLTQFQRDTLTDVIDSIGMGRLPGEIGLGATYYSGQGFALGVNYSTTLWSNFTSDNVNNPLNDTYKLSFGGYYRPNYKSISSYFSRVYYRFGFQYQLVPSEDLAANNGNNVKDYGLNIGFGLPFFYQRKISHANIGLSAGGRGPGTAIEEQYWKITFNFTFNDDEWFVKRKYN